MLLFTLGSNDAQKAILTSRGEVCGLRARIAIGSIHLGQAIRCFREGTKS
jgi:hypothetical protein